jgi:hypothetical protein
VGALQFVELRGGWPLPKGEVKVYSGGLKPFGIDGVLTPDGNGEKLGVGWLAVAGKDAVGRTGEKGGGLGQEREGGKKNYENGGNED